MNDMGAYLANASYADSPGGPPSADSKYGINILPVGEESTLFGKQPSDVMTLSLVQEASHDSAEFLRPRFASVAPDDRSLHSLDNLIDPAATVGLQRSHDMQEEGNAKSRHTSLAHAPVPTGASSKVVSPGQSTDRLDPEKTVQYIGEA